MGNIRSHRGIPKCLLDKFTYDSTHVWVYMLKNNKILSMNTKDVSVECGYYAENVENGLSDYESNFLNCINDLMVKLETPSIDCFELSKENEIRIIEYANISLLRSKYLFEYFFEDEAKKKLHEKNIILENTSDIMDFCLKNNFNLLSITGNNISFVLNKSSKEIITNSLGFYLSKNKNQFTRMFIPISPKYAIVISTEAKITYIDDENIDINNKNMYSFDKEFGYGFLISNEKVCLKSFM